MSASNAKEKIDKFLEIVDNWKWHSSSTARDAHFCHDIMQIMLWGLRAINDTTKEPWAGNNSVQRLESFAVQSVICSVFEEIEKELVEYPKGLMKDPFEEDPAVPEKISLLTKDELVEVLAADNKSELLIAGWVDQERHKVHLIKANLEKFAVPFAVFPPSGRAIANFEDFEIIDYGQTVRLGEYEAAVDAILEEQDADTTD